jgi:hypothetical protein
LVHHFITAPCQKRPVHFALALPPAIILVPPYIIPFLPFILPPYRRYFILIISVYYFPRIMHTLALSTNAAVAASVAIKSK